MIVTASVSASAAATALVPAAKFGISKHPIGPFHTTVLAVLTASANSFGDSLLEMDYLDYANKMKEKAAAKGVKLLLPVDNVVFCRGYNPYTADDQDINFIDQVVDNRNLAGYFGSTKDGNKRTLRNPSGEHPLPCRRDQKR